MAGTYHYKIAVAKGSLTATPFGEMAEDMPECTGANFFELEKAMVEACDEKSGKKFSGFNYQCDMLTPTAALFTACIGTAKASAVVAVAAPAAGGGGGAAAAAAKEPEPEPEEEEEDM